MGSWCAPCALLCAPMYQTVCPCVLCAQQCARMLVALDEYGAYPLLARTVARHLEGNQRWVEGNRQQLKSAWRRVKCNRRRLEVNDFYKKKKKKERKKKEEEKTCLTKKTSCFACSYVHLVCPLEGRAVPTLCSPQLNTAQHQISRRITRCNAFWQAKHGNH